MSEVDLNKVNSIKRDVAHYRGPSDHDGCVNDLRTMLTAYDAETARAEQAEAGCAALVKALKAQITMRDMKKPQKLEEELSWRENDELADRLAKEALTENPGQYLLDLVKACDGLPKCEGEITLLLEPPCGTSKSIFVGGLRLMHSVPLNIADALARLLAWRQGKP